METKTVIGIVLAVVVVGGGVWYAIAHPMKGAPGNMATTTTETSTTGQQDGTGTIAALWGMTGSLTCDVRSVEGAANPFTGTVYVSDGKMRVDSMAQISGKTYETHMLRMGDGFFYTWSSAMPQGIKISESQATAAPSGSTGNTAAANTQVSYSCKPWVTDSSKFGMPDGVTFMTLPSVPAR